MHKKSAGVKHYLATTGVHNPEQATPYYPVALYHGVFIEGWLGGDVVTSRCSIYERIWRIRYENGKQIVTKVKCQNIVSRAGGFADKFVVLQRYSEFKPKSFYK